MNDPEESYACQVCGKTPSPQTRALIDFGETDWAVHQLEVNNFFVQILTCPRCGKLGINQMVDQYQKRVKEGYELRYH